MIVGYVPKLLTFTEKILIGFCEVQSQSFSYLSFEMQTQYSHFNRENSKATITVMGRDSSVGTATTGWTIRGSNPGGGNIFRTGVDRPWGPPSFRYNGYRAFSGCKAAGPWR